MFWIYIIIDRKDLEKGYIILGVGNLVQEKNQNKTKSSDGFLFLFYFHWVFVICIT